MRGSSGAVTRILVASNIMTGILVQNMREILLIFILLLLWENDEKRLQVSMPTGRGNGINEAIRLAGRSIAGPIYQNGKPVILHHDPFCISICLVPIDKKN